MQVKNCEKGILIWTLDFSAPGAKILYTILSLNFVNIFLIEDFERTDNILTPQQHFHLIKLVIFKTFFCKSFFFMKI